jgi:hypothetical protein
VRASHDNPTRLSPSHIHTHAHNPDEEDQATCGDHNEEDEVTYAEPAPPRPPPRHVVEDQDDPQVYHATQYAVPYHHNP